MRLRGFGLGMALALGLGCAGCCFEIGEKTFCEVCGAYPAQRTPAGA